MIHARLGALLFFSASQSPAADFVSKDLSGKVVRLADFVVGCMEGERLLEAALAAAGIRVAPEILKKAAEDQEKRDARRAAPRAGSPANSWSGENGRPYGSTA